MTMTKRPGVIESGMSGTNRQRKLGTTRGSPRRSHTAKALRISRQAAKSRCACEWDGWGRLSEDGSGQNNPNPSEDPGAEDDPSSKAVALASSRPDTARDYRRHGAMHEGRMKTERSSVYVGSRLKLADDIGKASPESQPFSRTGENPRYGMLGGSRKRRHHSKPGPRLDPTRLRGRREILVPTATSKLTRDIFTLQTELVQPCVRPVSVVLVCASKSNLPLKVSNAMSW